MISETNRSVQMVRVSESSRDPESSLSSAQEKDTDVQASPQAKPPPNPTNSPPPNGGLQAWLHVLGGFMLFFNTWGILNTFGVYQTYYEQPGTLFTESSSNISCKCELLGAKLLLLAIIWEPRHMSAPETFPTFYSQFYS
jgi:hypothetical protein